MWLTDANRIEVSFIRKNKWSTLAVNNKDDGIAVQPTYDHFQYELPHLSLLTNLLYLLGSHNHIICYSTSDLSLLLTALNSI